MCCDICPYYEECLEIEKFQENCCAECPDYAECSGESCEEDTDEEEF